MPKTDDTIWKDPDLARAYLDGIRGAIPCNDEQLDVMLRLVKSAQTPIRRILDIGCGNGVLGAHLLKHFPKAEIVLLDFSSTMLEAAREKFVAHPNVQLAECDYGNPAWVGEAGGSYDAIVSGYSIHHQTHKRKLEIYGEVFDLLNPGGIFVNIEHVASATPQFSEIFDQRFIDALVVYEHSQGGTRERDELARLYYYRDDKSANILAPVEDQCEWLRAIGFEDVDCYFKLFELGVFGGRRAAA